MTMAAEKQETTKPGYKKTKLGWIPKEWDFLKVKEIAQLSSGGTPDRKERTYWNGTISWITTGEINFNLIVKSNEHISELGLKNSSAKIFPKGTILVAMYGQGKTRGKTALLGIDASTNQACAAIITNSRVDSRFLFYYFKHSYRRLRALSHLGNQDNLNIELIKNFDIHLPPKDEQQKIAEILGAWDSAIEKTRALIVAKEQQKKALMQQLLTGKKRFREFEGAEWKGYHYGDLVKEVRRHVEFDDDQFYPLISVRRRSGGLFHRESLHGHQIKTKDLRLARKGDFLISKMQVLHGATGLTTEEFDNMFISGSYIALVPKDKNKLDIEFFNWLSKTPLFYRHTFIASYGVTIEKMTFEFKYFLTLKVRIPGSIREQQKIAEVLQTADREIALLNQKLSALQQQKKGLMQKLLTGKVRVKV